MHDYFVISFTADAKQYTARVYPDHGEDGSRFYQVQYEQDRTIFVEPHRHLLILYGGSEKVILFNQRSRGILFIRWEVRSMR